MHYDYLIVGQGLSGTWLSYYLKKGGASVLVIDPGAEASASATAAGMINPITGKRLARQWMGETLFPFLQTAYSELGQELNIPLITELPIHQFFASNEEAGLFRQKADEGNEYLHPDSHLPEKDCFDAPLGHGTIFPAWIVDVRGLLNAWKKRLLAEGAYQNTRFDWAECRQEADCVSYGPYSAKAVIDCTGAAALTNPYFQALPFALNKGEVLLAEIPGLPRTAVYKFGKRSIIPWPEGGFWVGSSFDWSFTDNLPTEAFRLATQKTLERWLRLPFTLGESLAAVRPATITRDAFAGIHPLHPRLGLLDGMGSKACSQAPFLAEQFAAYMLEGRPLLARTDLQQYRKILSR